MLVINDRIKVPKKELLFTYTRSQGPGGQNVNKVNTKATMRWSVKKNRSLPPPVRQRFLERFKHRLTSDGELVLVSQRFRERLRNIEDCEDRLRRMIQTVATPPKKRKPTKPTRGSKIRRRKLKEANAWKKQSRKPPGIDN